jgi:hypothetical protein
MILTKENRNTLRRVQLIAILSSVNPTWPGLALNADLCDESLPTDNLSHGTTTLQFCCWWR